MAFLASVITVKLRPEKKNIVPLLKKKGARVDSQ